MKPFTLLLHAALLTGCSTRGSEYLYGENVNKPAFHLYSTTEGIYPDQSVLDDPENPFAQSTPSMQARWDIEIGGNPIASFYNWATLTARQPNGENQFYTAKNLAAIYTNSLAAPADLPTVKSMAIRAYQAMLDNFPNDVTYDVTGKIPYELDTPCLQGIASLGGTPKGWVLAQIADGGGARAVRP